MQAAEGLRQCSYASWYPRHADVSPPSRCIDLDAGFVHFLQEDGLVLHEQSEALPQRCQASDIIVEGVDYDPQDLYSDTSSTAAAAAEEEQDNTASDSGASCSSSSSDASGEVQPWSQRFPELHAAVAAAISALGGAVAPRLNWSSPTDALWLSSSNTLCCTNPDEVLLLLKGSDRVAHDLDQLHQLQQQQQQQQQNIAGQGVQDPVNSSSSSRPPSCVCAQLVLRRWLSLELEWQFRCFVHQHQLVAASQRDPSQHFPQLTGPQQQQRLGDIQARVMDFHRTHISNSFPLDSYAMDVYVPPNGPVQLLDFSPICDTTSPLCFTWDELPYSNMKAQQPAEQQEQQQEAQLQQQERQQHQHQHQQQDQGPQSCCPAPSVLVRVVEHEGMIVPGSRVATGMPFDMLGLPDAVSAVMKAMQEQQLKH